MRLLTYRSLIPLLSGVLLFSASCSGGSTVPTFEADQPSTLPSYWLTHVDEAAGFEISHPPDWLVRDLDRSAVEELLEAMRADEPSYGGNVYAAGTNPNVVVDIAALSDMTLDSYAELVSETGVQLAPSWELIRQTKEDIGDHEAVLLLSSFDVSDREPSAEGLRAWELQLAILAPMKTVWIVNCFTAAQTASDAEDAIATCESVVRSFKLDAPVT